MVYNYAFEGFNKETMARSCAANTKVSLKKSVEVAKYIQGKKVSTVINFLERVIEQKAVVPYKRFNQEMPHKRGVGITAGGYPVNVAKEFLRLVKAAEKNAKEQELSGELRVVSASARTGSTRYHYGRHSGRQMKSTSIEIVVGVKA
jgi:large subunit ribosomal protein L22